MNNKETTKEVANKVGCIIPKNILFNSIKKNLISLHFDCNSPQMFLLFLRKYKKYNTIRKLLFNECEIKSILETNKDNIFPYFDDYFALRQNIIEVVKIKSVYLIISTYGEDVLSSNGSKNEISALNIYFVGNKHKAYDLFREYNNFSDKIYKGIHEVNRKIYVITCNDDDGNLRYNLTDKRDINTVYNNHKNIILKYINNWKSLLMDNKDNSNIMNHIGILLYGEPGTGKTSLVMALASYTKYDIFTLNLLEYSSNTIIKYITQFKNSHQYNYDKKIPIILIEDIDILFCDRDSSDDLKYKNAFNLLLQILDGVYSVPGSIIIATTNHMEKLDPALIREGRFDLKIECKGLDEDEALQMINGFNEDKSILEGEEYPINPAYLQAKIMKYKTNKYLNRDK